MPALLLMPEEWYFNSWELVEKRFQLLGSIGFVEFWLFFSLCYQLFAIFENFGLFSLIFSIYLPSFLIKMLVLSGFSFFFFVSNGTWILYRWDQINIFYGWWRSYTCKCSQMHFESRVGALIQLFLSEYFEMSTIIFSNHFIMDIY